MKKRSFVLALLIAATSATAAPAGDFDTLTTWMTGSFSSAAQAAADTNYFDIRLRMTPIWPDLTDRWLYVEQAVATAQDRPYRQRVYQVTAGPDGTFRSEVYALPGPRRFTGAWQQAAPLSALAPDSLLLREGCAVVLRRAGADRFAGGTEGHGCASDLRGAAYATSEVSIGPDVIESWDRGFAADGTQAWGATGGGYVFRREPPDAPWPLIARAAWLVGRWETDEPDRIVEEHWLAPRGDAMLGVGRTLEGGQMVGTELIVLREKDGRLLYEAHPSGQPAAVFPATTISDTLLVFENPVHDFPQVIGYRRLEDGGLAAWVEGRLDGVPRRMEFAYRRGVAEQRHP